MSELTDRLRDDSWSRKHLPTYAELKVWHKTCCEAADKLEALTAERDELRAVVDDLAVDLKGYLCLTKAETISRAEKQAAAKAAREES